MMTSTNANVGTRRPSGRGHSKTYAAFNSLPTLRSKDNNSSDKSPNRKYKRPPLLADQLLFPGRRLDRPHRSTYSGYSGRSLDIETIISGGVGGGTLPNGAHLNSAEVNTAVGSAKYGSLLGNNFTRSLNDVTSQPWDSIRQHQLPSAHSHLSLLSRQGNGLLSTAGSSRSRGLANKFAGASASTGNLNASDQDLNSGGYPVSTHKWQFSGGNQRLISSTQNVFQEKVLRDLTSPDSSYSSESTSEAEWLGPPPPVVPLATKPLTSTVPGIRLQRQSSDASDRKKRSYMKKSTRRQSENTNQSSTPQLDKILWALVPDEFANISDTGVSDLEPTIPETTSSRHVTFTNLEDADLGSKGVPMATSRIPDTPRRPILTQETLSHLRSSVPNDDRILHWLAECDAHSLSASLPTHLPDISYTFKLANSKT